MKKGYLILFAIIFCLMIIFPLPCLKKADGRRDNSRKIDSGNENDYIHFHLRKADGSYLSVLDHGRIVESPQYGKVFYVLFMDWEDMHIHYSDKFSE